MWEEMTIFFYIFTFANKIDAEVFIKCQLEINLVLQEIIAVKKDDCEEYVDLLKSPDRQTTL